MSQLGLVDGVTALRSCTRCRRELPLTSFHRQRERGRPSGLSSWCRDCNNAARMDRKRARRAAASTGA